jgi:hypothetical protein
MVAMYFLPSTIDLQYQAPFDPFKNRLMIQNPVKTSERNNKGELVLVP